MSEEIQAAAETKESRRAGVSPDWLVRGVLTKIGDTLDRFTGRRWQPSSNLATSELAEKLKKLLEEEIRIEDDGRRFVPHNISLKMQWDKFSTDSERSLRSLKTELLTSAVDFINDNRFYTYAPLTLEVKPDYFTSGVKLFVSFDRFADEEHEAELNVSVPGMTTGQLVGEAQIEESLPDIPGRAMFSLNGVQREVKLLFADGKRSSVGRTKENDLALNDPSVSKMHASLMLDRGGQLFVADTGSTNGTFIGGERIPYGKAVQVSKGQKVTFGTVGVLFDIMLQAPAKPLDPLPRHSLSDDGRFATKIDAPPAAATQPSMILDEEEKR